MAISATPLQLSDPATYTMFAEGVQAIIQQHDIAAAIAFVAKFTPKLQKSGLDQQSHELYQQYRDLLIQTSWLALPALSEKEVFDLFEKHLLVGLSLREDPPFDVWEQLRGKLRTIMVIEERNRLKQEVRKVLLRNEERMTIVPLIIDGKEELGTLANWFRDYHREVGTGKLDSLKQNTYFAQGKNFQKLSPQEKERLKKIFHLYEKTKLSSLTPEGFEDPIGVDDAGGEGTIVDGRFERLDPTVAKKIEEIGKLTGTAPIPKSAPIASVAPAKISPFSLPARTVLPPKKDASKFFFDFLFSPQGTKVASAQELTVALSMLVEQNALEKTLIDPKVREAFTAYLKTKNAPDLLGGFRLAPTMPRFMGLFLQWVLQEKGKMSENDAARVGAQLANTLKKKYGNEKYMRIAYYDAGSGQFKWS